MPLTDGYTREERERISAAARLRQPLHCPRCGAALTQSHIPPSPGISYVRKRALIACSACHRRAAVDLPRDPR